MSATTSRPNDAERSRRRRRPSPTRRVFLATIQAQITGTRILAALTFLVLLAAGAVWLVGTTGSPLVGVSFLVMAGALAVSVYWFLQVMGMFTGRR